MPDRHIFRLTYFKNIEQFLIDSAVYAKNHQMAILDSLRCLGAYRLVDCQFYKHRLYGVLKASCGGCIWACAS